MLRNFSNMQILCQPAFSAEKFGYSSDFRRILLKMLHLCNILGYIGISRKHGNCKGRRRFLVSLPFGKKDNLAKSVTFWAATIIGFLFSINIIYFSITYIKQKVKVKG